MKKAILFLLMLTSCAVRRPGRDIGILQYMRISSAGGANSHIVS